MISLDNSSVKVGFDTTTFLIENALSNFFLIPYMGILGVAVSVIIINLMQACGARIQMHIYKINRNFYLLRLNHIYSLCIIVAYFLAYTFLYFNKINLKYSNYFPLIITFVFAIILLIRNKAKFIIYLTPILEFLKLKNA